MARFGFGFGARRRGIGIPPIAAAPNIVLAAITGTAEDGETLTAVGVATGYPSPSFAYQWQKNGANIAGQTAQTIVLNAATMTLADGDTISCEMIASNGEGSDSAEPTIVFDVPPVLPGAISDLMAMQMGDGIHLMWTPASDAVSHEYRVDGGTPVATDAADEQHVMGLTAATEYDFEVRGVNGTGNGPWSNVATDTTAEESEAATAPVLTQTSAAGGNPLAWSSAYTDLIPDADDYVVMRYRENGGAWITETPVFVDSAWVAMYIVDGDPPVWPLYDADTFAPDTLVEVQEGVTRGADATVWSNIVGDTVGEETPGEWTPLSLGSKLKVWYDPSDAGSVTTASGNVSQIDDLSVNANHATQATSGNRPAYAATGWESALPSMNFNPTESDHLLPTTPIAYSGATGLSIHMCVAQQGGNFRSMFSSLAPGGPHLKWLAENPARLMMVRSFEAEIVTSTFSATEGVHIVGVDIATNKVDFYLDGVKEPHAVDGGFDQPIDMIGSNNSSLVEDYDGPMGEIVIAELLTTEETDALLAYLQAKWTP